MSEDLVRHIESYRTGDLDVFTRREVMDVHLQTVHGLSPDKDWQAAVEQHQSAHLAELRHKDKP